MDSSDDDDTSPPTPPLPPLPPPELPRPNRNGEGTSGIDWSMFEGDITRTRAPPSRYAASSTEIKSRARQRATKKRDRSSSKSSNPAKKSKEYHLQKEAFQEYSTRKFKATKEFQKLFGEDEELDAELYKEVSGALRNKIKELRERQEENVVIPALMKVFPSDSESEEDSEDTSEDTEDSEDDEPPPSRINKSNCVKKTINIDFGVEAARKMTFFEPVARNVVGKDEKRLPYVPLVGNNTNDIRVCADLYEVYTNGIHGYSLNNGDVSDQFLFDLMREILPFSEQHPDLLYYALYRNFPNSGSQEEFARMFPKFVSKFVEAPADREALLKLEPWKIGWKWEEDDEIEKPFDDVHTCSKGNAFSKFLPLPMNDGANYCSENCFKSLTRDAIGRLKDNCTRHAPINHIGVYIGKWLKKDADFYNSLILGDRNGVVVDFCRVAGQHSKNTCAGWYLSLLKNAQFKEIAKKKKVNDQDFKKQMEAERAKRQKQRQLDEQKAKEEDVEFHHSPRNTFNDVFPLKPCCHFGPCGPDVKSCSCHTYCTIYCQCDSQCVRRFNGCNCTLGGCATKNCPCWRLGWECLEATCKCLHSDCSCRNNQLTKENFKPLQIKVSTIEGAGNGAFIKVDAEKGDLIGEYVGEKLSPEEEKRRGRLYALGVSYTFGLGPGFGCIDATRAGNALRFVNHSDKPNCFARVMQVAGELRIAYFADQHITAGTELFIDYGYDKRSAKKFFELEPEDRAPKMSRD